MFKIGEFSKLTQVSIRMLRYYDEMGLLKPAETDKFTGYRLYAAQQIPQLNKIVFLRDLGFQVSEIAATLANWDDAFITEQLERKRREIEGEMAAQRKKLRIIQQAKEDIQREAIGVHYNVSIKSVPGCLVFSLRRVVPDYYAEGALWKEMAAYAKGQDIPLSDRTFTIYHDTEYSEDGVDIEVCAPVHRMGTSGDGFRFREIAPVPLMACTMVYGPFENIAGVYYAFADWLQTHDQYRMTGQSRQIVHRGPWNEENPDHYLTEIQIPLEQR